MKKLADTNPLVWVVLLIVLAIVLLPGGDDKTGIIPWPFGLIGGLLGLALVFVAVAASNQKRP